MHGCTFNDCCMAKHLAIVNTVCTLNLHSLYYKFHSHSMAFIITAAAGAVDEASFFALFEDVPKVTIYSNRELEDTLTKVREIIASPSTDWDKRVDAVSRLVASQVFGIKSKSHYCNFRGVIGDV